MKDPVFYTIFINEKISQLQEITGENVSSALEDLKTELAAERLLHVISDATKFLPEEEKAKHKDIAWSKIVGFRNVIVHDYLGISKSILIDIIEKEIPLIQKAIQEMLLNHGI
jgi:uncharacterized protein with HEPN domain